MLGSGRWSTRHPRCSAALRHALAGYQKLCDEAEPVKDHARKLIQLTAEVRYDRAVCRQILGKLTPQHMGKHGPTLDEAYRRSPQLGFTGSARVGLQPDAEGILRNAEVYGLVVAGEGFEPTTSGL